MPDILSSGGCVLVSVHGEAFLSQLREFLSSLGCVVVEVAVGQEVLSALSSSTADPDVLVVDAPASIAREALQSHPGMKVLVISCEPEYVNRAVVPDKQISFIEKPFAWCELRQVIESLLSLRLGPAPCGFDGPIAAAAG